MKNTFRFFVPPEALRADELHLADQTLAHQLLHVLRLRQGDRVLLLDGLGTVCEVELVALSRSELRGRVVERKAAPGEPPCSLTVYLPLIRAERFEWALQKCVELGADRLVPVAFARSQVADRADGRKAERWRRIVREAAEQACRGRLPSLAQPLAFTAACAEASTADLSFLLWEGEAPHLARMLQGAGGTALPAKPALAILSGPEGGITADELAVARGRGIMPVSLGQRILRAETAPIAAAALLIGTIEGQSQPATNAT